MGQKIGGKVTPNSVPTGVGSLADEETKARWRRVHEEYEQLGYEGVPPKQRNLKIAVRLGLSRRTVKRCLVNFKRAKKAGNI